MKTIFDPAIRQELVDRIEALKPDITPLWGKMTAYQMLRHCASCDDMVSGEVKIKRVFIGRLIGNMILKQVLKNEKPFKKNSPTSPLLLTAELNGDWELVKQEWKKRIDNYSNYSPLQFAHPFFGKMTKEQVGYFAYKHADHHLRQFGV